MPQASKHTRRWLQPWPIVCVAIAVLVVASLWFWASWRNQLNLRLAAIVARGEPTSFVELNTYYPAPPTERDATDLWLRLALLCLRPSKRRPIAICRTSALAAIRRYQGKRGAGSIRRASFLPSMPRPYVYFTTPPTLAVGAFSWVAQWLGRV